MYLRVSLPPAHVLRWIAPRRCIRSARSFALGRRYNTYLTGIASFVGAPTNLQGGSVRGADSPTSVKVMGGMPSDARKTLGRFYYPHNAQLLHTLAQHQSNMHFAPSLKSLGIQGWAGA